MLKPWEEETGFSSVEVGRNCVPVQSGWLWFRAQFFFFLKGPIDIGPKGRSFSEGEGHEGRPLCFTHGTGVIAVS